MEEISEKLDMVERVPDSTIEEIVKVEGIDEDADVDDEEQIVFQTYKVDESSLPYDPPLFPNVEPKLLVNQEKVRESIIRKGEASVPLKYTPSMESDDWRTSVIPEELRDEMDSSFQELVEDGFMKPYP